MPEISAEALAALEDATKKVIKSYTLRPINEEVTSLKAAAGNHNLDSDAIESGRMAVITSIAALDEDSAPDWVKLGPYDGTLEYWHKTKSSPAAGETVTYVGMLTLSEGDVIRARFEGATADDDLYAWVNGWWTEI